MIRAQFNRDGTFRSVTLPGRPGYHTDSPEVQWALSWLRLHDVDPLVVPLGAVVMYDAEFDEWRFPVMVPVSPGAVRMNAERTGPLIRVIRRRVRTDFMQASPEVDVQAELDSAPMVDPEVSALVVNSISEAEHHGGPATPEEDAAAGPKVVVHLSECEPDHHPDWATTTYSEAVADGGVLCAQTDYMADELFREETVWIERAADQQCTNHRPKLGGES